jgi:hypothetical protein
MTRHSDMPLAKAVRRLSCRNGEVDDSIDRVSLAKAVRRLSCRNRRGMTFPGSSPILAKAVRRLSCRNLDALVQIRDDQTLAKAVRRLSCRNQDVGAQSQPGGILPGTAESLVAKPVQGHSAWNLPCRSLGQQAVRRLSCREHRRRTSRRIGPALLAKAVRRLSRRNDVNRHRLVLAPHVQRQSGAFLAGTTRTTDPRSQSGGPLPGTLPRHVLAKPVRRPSIRNVTLRDTAKAVRRLARRDSLTCNMQRQPGAFLAGTRFLSTIAKPVRRPSSGTLGCWEAVRRLSGRNSSMRTFRSNPALSSWSNMRLSVAEAVRRFEVGTRRTIHQGPSGAFLPEHVRFCSEAVRRFPSRNNAHYRVGKASPVASGRNTMRQPGAFSLGLSQLVATGGLTPSKSGQVHRLPFKAADNDAHSSSPALSKLGHVAPGGRAA